MSLTIGQLAAEAGVRIDTVRYYERRGLLPAPPRRPSGYRIYPPETVHSIRFIKKAQELGFSLTEIADLIAFKKASGRCDDVRQRAEAKIADIDGKIRGLRSMRKALASLVQTCVNEGRPTYCPILESLADKRSRK